MSEGEKFDVWFGIRAAIRWLPYFAFDNESNFVFFQMEWLCIYFRGSWQK